MSVSREPNPSPVDAPATRADLRTTARRLRLAGHVQGVGFRPFVYRLARELGLAGSVQNLRGEVEIRIEGSYEAVERFGREVTFRAPPLARPQILTSDSFPVAGARDFVILESASGSAARVYVPPDAFTCSDCLAELTDPTDRRHRYPFINCTQCGPRYTLIEALPYDRIHTTMAGFTLCERCRKEYECAADRRFHAEPVACPSCGPHVWLEVPSAAPADEAVSVVVVGQREVALSQAVERLLDGAIVAVKGVGGYHLLCDATRDEAVARLRQRKHRPGKPLAVMFPQTGPDGLERVRCEVELTDLEARVLLASTRPIVLARKRADCTLAPSVAPGLAEIGVFLPYSPLHHLLLADAGRPLVATSGNVSGEPVLTDEGSARILLAQVADAWLHHDRSIARPADDSVVRCLAGSARTIRLGRGLGPLELELPCRLERPVLATGGHLKTTIALAWESRVVISPHIGDMSAPRSMTVWTQVARDLQRLYGVQAAEIVCDAHPDYATTRWAESCGLPVHYVWHHHAHASAIAGECSPSGPMLVFAWDGVGLGDDGTLWGGEAFVGSPGTWRRVASVRPFRLPGGEAAAREPWRSAAGICWEIDAQPAGLDAHPLARRAWQRRVNCPQTSSVGRLFQAAAALVLGVSAASYEGEAEMRLEAAAGPLTHERESCAPRLPIARDSSGLARIEWAPLVALLTDRSRSVADRAARFHSSLADSIVAIAEMERLACGVRLVGLGGGVFQNARLTKLTGERLVARGFRVGLAECVPCNDGGLSYGQIIEFAGRNGLGQARC